MAAEQERLKKEAEERERQRKERERKEIGKSQMMEKIKALQKTSLGDKVVKGLKDWVSGTTPAFFDLLDAVCYGEVGEGRERGNGVPQTPFLNTAIYHYIGFMERCPGAHHTALPAALKMSHAHF